MFSNTIREEFLKFFINNGHDNIASSSLIPVGDKSLLLTNAGMVQFKNIFIGEENPKIPRAVTAQKCMRAGGKHNDLEQVGYTERHLTFFEMMGNFSFGDYFKEKAIQYAWYFCTNILELDQNKLFITTHPNDKDAKKIWTDIAKINDNKIYTVKENFWAMGNTGPCGYCSEIYYDLGEDLYGEFGEEEVVGSRFMEIWNLVFMEYDQSDNGDRKRLAKQSIDTGAGLERLAAVMQNKRDIYHTDILMNIIKVIQKLSNTTTVEPSHKVVADHIRAACFMISDGIYPSNEGRGFVLRKIIRRCVRHIKLLNIEISDIKHIVNSVVDNMSIQYQQLKIFYSNIVDVLIVEAERFDNLLDSGIIILDQHLNNNILSGDIAFKMYDTYGFPIEITREICSAKNITIDNNKFEQLMEEQRNNARANMKKETINLINITNDFNSVFVGYDSFFSETKIKFIICNGQSTNSCDKDCFVITEETPFYAESGGQIGDTGIIKGKNFDALVIDTISSNGINVHKVIVQYGIISVGDLVNMSIDIERRKIITAHHTAAHIVHGELRKMFGEQVMQAGSCVSDKSMRMDFSYHKSITPSEIEEIESRVNSFIESCYNVEISTMNIEKAKSMGAIALFGEKYGENVRVVNIGEGKSVELCGGCHLKNTGSMRLFKIISERSVASGIRRVEAISGNSAINLFNNRYKMIDKISNDLKSEDVENKVISLINDNKKMKDTINFINRQKYYDQIKTTEINGVSCIILHMENIDNKEVKKILDKIKNTDRPCFIILTNTQEGRVNINIQSIKLDSAKDLLVNILSECSDGNGGGNKDFASGSCVVDVSKIDSIIKKYIK